MRLGFGELVVLDDDEVDISNLSRLHESALTDVGRPKVNVVSRAGRRIGLGTKVTSVRKALRNVSALAQLTRCDVIFGCTDDQFGRAVLSRLAYWYLIPVVDSGVLIESLNGGITDLVARVTYVAPGSACLLCRERISPAGIQLEAMGPEERRLRVAEGYAPELSDPAPSVVTFTTIAASYALSEILERLFDYGSGNRPSELLLRFRDRDLARNSVSPKEGHYCDDQLNWGRGDMEPRLNQIWP
jgi:molybdopterin/thiamine biosynthesis adenylyltransferase